MKTWPSDVRYSALIVVAQLLGLAAIVTFFLVTPGVPTGYLGAIVGASCGVLLAIHGARRRSQPRFALAAIPPGARPVRMIRQPAVRPTLLLVGGFLLLDGIVQADLSRSWFPIGVMWGFATMLGLWVMPEWLACAQDRRRYVVQGDSAPPM